MENLNERIETVKALAVKLIGGNSEPKLYQLHMLGLPEDWSIHREHEDVQKAFHQTVGRCSQCEFWCASEELFDDVCPECRLGCDEMDGSEDED